MFETAAAELPEFESVRFWGALDVPTPWGPKVRLVGDRVRTGWTAVPARLTVCGLPLALSVTPSDALRVPAAVGANVTLIVQPPPAVTLLPQVFVWAKSPGFVPPMAMPDMLKEALPVFESVIVCGELVVPVLCWLKVRLAGDSDTAGAGGGGLPPLPPPPPQATQIPTASNAAVNSKLAARRRARARLISMASPAIPANSQGQWTGGDGLGGILTLGTGGAKLLAPTVVMVRVVVAAEEAVTLKYSGETEQLIPQVHMGT